MRDFTGQDLKIGDEVITCGGYGSTDYLSIGVVTGFTPKNIRVSGRVMASCRVYKIPKGF